MVQSVSASFPAADNNSKNKQNTNDDNEIGGKTSEFDASAKSSMLSPRDDPFAPREGKHLIWKDVNVIYKLKRNHNKNKKDDGGDNDDDYEDNYNGNTDVNVDMKKKKILSNVWGEVPSHKTTAIMGSSGAGKTTLLNVLSGRIQSHGSMTIETDIRLDNFRVNPANIQVRKYIAYVDQDDSIQVTQTPREAIAFSARLRLPRSTSDYEINKLTKRMLNELGLMSCADTMVGGALLKGISGGERKRTSVGIELVTKPEMVFLDEPTSGLDSFNAVRLCNVLKKVANAGSSVLFTIHQPASEIFASFDQLILLNKGRIMYQGPSAGVPDFFESCGHPCPQHYNPADWVMNVAQTVPIDELEAKGFFPKDERKLPEAFTEKYGHDPLGATVNSSDNSSNDDGNSSLPVGIASQTKLLFRREVSHLFRHTLALKSRMALTLFLAFLIGCMFFGVASTDYKQPSNLQSAFGAMLMAILAVVFSTVLPSLLQFPEERPVFLREYSTNHYSVVSYFISRLTMETLLTGVQVLLSSVVTYFMVEFNSRFPIFFSSIYIMAMAGNAVAVLLGSSVTDPKVAVEMLPVLFLPQILFSGFFVTPALIPAWLRWLRYIFPLTFAVRILLVEEFDGQCELIFGMDLCSELIKNVDACADDLWWYWLCMFIIFIIFRLLALFVLTAKATSFFT